MKDKNLTIVTWREDGQWISECLNNHVSSFGDSKEQALKNINEALSLFFEDGSEEVPDIEEASLSKSVV